MRVTRWLPALVLLLPGCAHLGAGPSEGWERARLWDEAHGYFATYDFERADSVFSLIAREHPETDEGRESLFYLGALRVDPRNPEWDAEVSEARLRESGAVGALTPEFEAALRADPGLLVSVARLLLDANFPESLHADLCLATGLDLDALEVGVAQTRLRQLRARLKAS